MKVLGESGDATFSGLQRDLALSKHENNRDKSAARIGLFWRNRAKFKALRLRMDALFEIQAKLLRPIPPLTDPDRTHREPQPCSRRDLVLAQERLLLEAVAAIEKDQEVKNRNKQSKDLSTRRSSGASSRVGPA